MQRCRRGTAALLILICAAGVVDAQYTSKDAPYTAEWVYKALLDRNIDAPSLAGRLNNVK